MSNVPKLRFKEFSGEWEEKIIEDILKIGSGKDYKHLSIGNIPVYGTGGYMTSVDGYLYEGESVCIGRKGTIDKPVFLNGKFWTVDTLFYTHSFKDSIPKFVFSIFQKINWKLYNEASGVPSLSKSTIGKIKINIPSKSEQEKIASFLTAVDTKIEQLTKKESLLQEYKKGVMQNIFNQEIRFKDDDGSEFCEWEEKKLGEVTYKASKKNKDNIPYPIYSINNKVGFVPQAEQFEGMDSVNRNYDISMYKILQENTFAYNPSRINVGSLGYCGDLRNIIISSLYVCFKTKENINDYFLLQYFSTYEFNKKVLRNIEGGVRDYLFYENFSNIKTSFPSIEEQNKISNFLSSIDKKIENIKNELEKTKEFKKALLQQMFV